MPTPPSAIGEHGRRFPLLPQSIITPGHVTIENTTNTDETRYCGVQRAFLCDGGDEVWLCGVGADGLSHGDEPVEENDPTIEFEYLRCECFLPDAVCE